MCFVKFTIFYRGPHLLKMYLTVSVVCLNIILTIAFLGTSSFKRKPGITVSKIIAFMK